MLIYILNLSVFHVPFVKKLYDDCFHEWKTVSVHLLSKYFGSTLKFHSNLHFENKVSEEFPSFYKQRLINFKKSFIAPPITPSYVLMQFLWYNRILCHPRNAIPEMWKKCIKQSSENTSLLVVKDHHLLRSWRIMILEKLSSKNYIHC